VWIAYGREPLIAIVLAVHPTAGGAITMPRLLRNFPTLILIATFFVGCSQGKPLPNGYAVFFASGSEAGLVKPAAKGGEIIAGPHIAELGNSGAGFPHISPVISSLFQPR